MKTLLAVMMMYGTVYGMSIYDPENALPSCNYVRVIGIAADCMGRMNTTAALVDPLQALGKECSQQPELTKCFVENVTSSCSNVGDAIMGHEVMFRKCKRGKPQSDLAKYINEEYSTSGSFAVDKCGDDYNFTSARKCLLPNVRPGFHRKFLSMSYMTGVTFMNDLFSRSRVCFADFIALPVVNGCNGRSGRQVFMDTLTYFTTLPVVGVDVYGYLIEFQQQDFNMQLAQVEQQLNLGDRDVGDLEFRAVRNLFPF